MVGGEGVLGGVWRAGDCEGGENGGAVPAGEEDAGGDGEVSWSIQFLFKPKLIRLVMLRTGDIVTVRVAEDGESLNIKDNHPSDKQVGASAQEKPSLLDGASDD